MTQRSKMTPKEKLIAEMTTHYGLVNVEEDEGDYVIFWTLVGVDPSGGRRFTLKAVNPLTGSSFEREDHFWELDNFWEKFREHDKAIRCSIARAAQNAVEAPTDT